MYRAKAGECPPSQCRPNRSVELGRKVLAVQRFWQMLLLRIAGSIPVRWRFRMESVESSANVRRGAGRANLGPRDLAGGGWHRIPIRDRRLPPLAHPLGAMARLQPKFARNLDLAANQPLTASIPMISGTGSTASCRRGRANPSASYAQSR